MGYQPPITIAETLRRIQRGELILPAIQREYVWRPRQVTNLFDSLMRGYPIGSFLTWRVEPDTAEAFKFYGFMKDYNAFDSRHNPVLDLPPGRQTIAVLDGQQRLTSLNVGLRGTYAYRNPRSWAQFKSNYPTRALYLYALDVAEENEWGVQYDFRFLTPEQAAEVNEEGLRPWFPVRAAFEAERPSEFFAKIRDAGLGNHPKAPDMLGRLQEAIHYEPTVHMYEETDQDVERVLDIFIRVNSGGTVLSYSDLLLSMATALWKERDARAAIHGLVDTLNAAGAAGAGFAFTQDVVLKSGLVIAGISDIGFKVKNFTATNMAKLDDMWEQIDQSLQVAAGLLSDFGLSRATLTAGSVIIPVAHYVHARRLDHHYRGAPQEAEDRARLRRWVLRSLVMPGIWGSGLDSLLRDLRAVINEHGATSFPAEALERRMAARGKSLAITAEQVEDLLDLGYGAPRTYALLALLFPHVNTRNQQHVDHIFPASRLSRSGLRTSGLAPDVVERVYVKGNQLPNLQLLEGQENIGKSDEPPAEWLARTYPDDGARAAYLDRNQISFAPRDVSEFEEFFDARRAALKVRIVQTLGTAADDVAAER